MQMLEAEDSMRAKAWTWVEVGSGQQQGAPGFKEEGDREESRADAGPQHSHFQQENRGQEQ